MVEFRGYQEEKDTATLDWSYLAALWPFVRPYRAAFAVCLGILLVSFGLEIAGPYLLRMAIDGPVTDAAKGLEPDTDAIAWIGAGFLLVTVLAATLGYQYAMITTRNGQRVIRDVRTALYAHILRLGPKFFEGNPAGKLVTRATSDVENLNELISTGVLQTVFDLLKIVGILVVLSVLDLQLALVALVATPIVIAVSLVFRNFVRLSYRRVRACLARQNAFTAEAVGGIRVTRMFGREDAVERHYRELNGDTQDAWVDTVSQFAWFMGLVDITLRLAQVGILYTGGMAILDGSLTIGVFVMFWVCFGKLTEPIRELGEKYNVLQSAFSSSERIFAILGEQPAPKSPADPRPTGSGAAHLTFEHVDFAYRPDLPVLRDVSFEVRPGESCALVGPTGAGKTTVLALVSRLYDPTAGRVLLDGVPLPELDLWAARRRIAVVPQDVFLFSGSVLDNVRLFDETITEAQVTDALEAIGAMEFVRALDGGIHGEVQERGATFSQGERQLLAFARALVTDPDLLVLDEATANIDNDSEEMIQRGLQRLLKDRTALIVAHRLSTVRNADQILVIRDGELTERGDHDQLMQRDGLYARMVRLA